MSLYKRECLLVVIGVTLFFCATTAYSAGPAKSGEGTGSAGKLDFWANMRMRYEYQDDFNVKSYGHDPVVGEANDGFLLGRFRMGFGYTPFKNIHLAVGTQHSEVWDLALEERDFFNAKLGREHNPYEDSWELYNTYLEIRELLLESLTLKAGRQLIYYGDKRIFGPGQWGNTGMWIWDAVKLSYEFKTGFIDAFYGKTMIHDPDVFSLNHNHGFESFGFYGHLETPGNRKIAFEPFAMTKENDKDRFQGEDWRFGDLDSFYFGAYVYDNDFKGLDWGLTYVRQEGDYANDDVDAYGYNFTVAYNFNQIAFNPRPGFEFSYASGDGDPNDGIHQTFDGAFGARDMMYGRMNLFHWMNLKDAQLNLELRPHKRLYLKAEYHQFWLAEEEDAWYLNPKAYRDRTGESGDKVGKEFDLICIYNLSRRNQIQAGFGHFWPDEFAENQASDEEANWVFLQWMWSFSYPLL